MQVTPGLWRHSHEEDAAGRTVFRPESFAFPRSRGRVALRLNADGSAVRYPIGADDRSGAVPGSWLVVGRQLSITDAGATTPAHVWNVIAAGRDELILKPSA